MKKFSLIGVYLILFLFAASCGKAKVPVRLTLEEVQKLSSKGDDLSWKDFEIYQGTETGSGLYIMIYPINDEYSVMVGGGSTSEKPMYIYLVNKIIDQKIDIRHDNVKDFIEKAKK